jgi:hypothetical protein
MNFDREMLDIAIARISDLRAKIEGQGKIPSVQAAC